MELMRRRTSKEVPPDEDDPARAAKRRRVRGPEREQALEEGGGEELQGGGGAAPDAALLARGEGLAPIDHIFQFHEALRLELTRLEDEAMALDGTDEALRRLDGRFQFLWSIYHAHSHAEDAVVFPALEGKEALHSVTKSYAMDHREEEVLFRQANALIQGLLRTLPGTSERREQTAALRRVCAAIHAAVDTHVRAEEEGLWPLFVEHFSWDEQRQLVGIIIGRTGAEVLQAMLPWVQTSLPQDEVESMIFSLKEVRGERKESGSGSRRDRIGG